MPRRYPSEPDFAEERRAERVVWEALRDQLPAEAVLFHSVPLIEGGREQELDLLVAWPGVGRAVLEVKGGHVTAEGGRWHQESRGQRRPIGSPVLQAQDGKHVLSRYLQQHSTAGVHHARTAHVAALPFTAVAADFCAPDLPRAMLIAQDDIADCAGIVKRAIEQHGAGHAPLDAAGVEVVVGLLAGQLVGQTSLLSAAEEHEQRVEQMTRDQLKTLENLAYHRRLKVIGGAGTGEAGVRRALPPAAGRVGRRPCRRRQRRLRGTAAAPAGGARRATPRGRALRQRRRRRGPGLR